MQTWEQHKTTVRRQPRVARPACSRLHPLPLPPCPLGLETISSTAAAPQPSVIASLPSFYLKLSMMCCRCGSASAPPISCHWRHIPVCRPRRGLEARLYLPSQMLYHNPSRLKNQRVVVQSWHQMCANFLLGHNPELEDFLAGIRYERDFSGQCWEHFCL